MTKVREMAGWCYIHTYISTHSIYEEVCFPKNFTELMVRTSVDRMDQKNDSRIFLKETIKPVFYLFRSTVSNGFIYCYCISSLIAAYWYKYSRIIIKISKQI